MPLQAGREHFHYMLMRAGLSGRQPQAAGLGPVRAMVTVKATRAVLFAQKHTKRW
jgi:hypothetical protein